MLDGDGTVRWERTIALDGHPYEIVGVMRPGFAFPLNTTQLWRPYALDESRYDRDYKGFQVVGREEGRCQQTSRQFLPDCNRQPFDVLGSRHRDRTQRVQVGSDPLDVEQSIVVETEEVRRGGKPENFGAVVQELKAQGLRGRELAEAIHGKGLAVP